jgi:hypothetical protein
VVEGTVEHAISTSEGMIEIGFGTSTGVKVEP